MKKFWIACAWIGTSAAASITGLSVLAAPSRVPASEARAAQLPPDLSMVCSNPTEALCTNLDDRYETYLRRRQKVLERAKSRLSREDVLPADWLGRARPEGHDQRMLETLEIETLAEAKRDRASVKADFERIRDGLLDTVRGHADLPADWRAAMEARLQRVEFRLASEYDTDEQVCGERGTDIQAFAVPYVSPPLIVLCPMLVLQQAMQPEVPSYDFVIAHELGHHIDSSQLLTVGGEAVLPYHAYFSCLKDTLGIPVHLQHTGEVTADFWGMETFTRLHRGEDAAATARSLSGNSFVFCINRRVDADMNFLPDSPDWSTDAHLPSNARLSQAMIYSPGIRKILGCQPFTPALPGCGLQGPVTK